MDLCREEFWNEDLKIQNILWNGKQDTVQHRILFTIS